MKVAFLGKTGAGKSSLLNALFGLDFPTGRYQATTLDIQYAEVDLADPDGGDGQKITIVDTPGFAESQETEALYRRLYAELLPSIDHVVWVVPAHPRVYRADQEALIELDITTGMTVALTRADTIGPNDWDEAEGRPSPGQTVSLAEQAANVLAKLAPYAARLASDDIVPCSPPRRYGLDAITERIRAASAVHHTRD